MKGDIYLGAVSFLHISHFCAINIKVNLHKPHCVWYMPKHQQQFRGQELQGGKQRTAREKKAKLSSVEFFLTFYIVRFSIEYLEAKPKPKYALWPITKNADCPFNQSKLQVNTCS